MNSLCWLALGFAVLAMTSASQAAEPASSATNNKSFWDDFERSLDSPEQISGDRILIRPGSSYYSASVAGTGAHGTAILLLDLSKDGQVTGARVHTSSRSDELDASAIRKALTMSYQGKGAPPSTVSLKVDFRRDSPYTLSAKTCQDLNVDIAWFRNAFPGRPETDLPAIMALGNLVRLNYGSADRWLREPIFNAVPFAQCAVVPGCAANPTETVGKLFNHALNEHKNNPDSERDLCAFSPPPASNAEKLPRSLLHIALDEPIWAKTQHITPQMRAYPPALIRSGVQGHVVLEVTLTNQGQISDVKISNNGSGVAALGDAAVAYARTLPLGPGARAEAPETIVMLPVQFEKDTKDSIGNKTCSEFNIDAGAYRSSHPTGDLRAMNAMAVARSVFGERGFDAATGRNPRNAVNLATEEDIQLIAERCTQQPQARFMDVFREQMLTIHP